MSGLTLRLGKSPASLTALWFAIAIAAAVGFALLSMLGEWRGTGRLHTRASATAVGVALDRLPARPEDIASQRLEPLAEEVARELNAAIPFADAKPLPARPFHFSGGLVDRARAVDCLALAAMAEAGGSDEGQRAVIQVILNRVRHPAFAKSVCGVVFQGSERATGCQFTFTCDGSLSRRYSEAAWVASRKRANEALDGHVFASVGTATHYHTDWVHPVWSSQLSKIARVETHLFFRWPGYWGSREAARIAYASGEPAIRKIAWLESHAAAAGEADSAMLAAGPEAPVHPGDSIGIRNVVVSFPDDYMVQLTQNPGAAPALAAGRKLCGGRGYCRVLGWTDKAAIPRAFPVPLSARAKLGFSYVIDKSGAEYVFYDCRLFSGVERDRCMPPPA